MVDIQQRELMEGSAERPELEIFQQQWNLYRKIVDNDYFSGADVYREFNRFLSAEIARPFRLLDLACGDASGIVGALKGTQIVHYHGVDLSLPALELAKRHLDVLSCEIKLEHADFVDVARDRSHRRDIVWFGLSLHHLTTLRKRALMRDIRNLVAADGVFAIYEPTLGDGENLPAYLDRFEQFARGTWKACTSKELDLALEHVRSCDLPETGGDWVALAREAGFSKGEEIFRAPTDLFRMFVFRA